MDFGKILNQWDKLAGSVYDKDTDSASSMAGFSDRRTIEFTASRRKRLLRKSPDASIDLHGLTRDEAWNALTVFFTDSKDKGLEKVLIIHGKGNHTGADGKGDEGVLKKMVRDFVEYCPFAGENGYSGASSGGTGSTWVLLKNSSFPG